MFDFHGNFDRLPLASECLVLDFGCGPGRNLDKYSPNFKRVDGVDISHVAWIMQSFGYNIKAYNNNILYKTNGKDLSEIEGWKYDAVMSTITLQHIAVHRIRFSLFKEFLQGVKNWRLLYSSDGLWKG